MTVGTPTFDPAKFKRTTREQWQEAAEAWDRWGPTLEDWLGPATEAMLDGAGVRVGARVLDVAAGAGGQTMAAARRVGPTGHVLATDLSPAILEYAAAAARNAGLENVETREVVAAFGPAAGTDIAQIIVDSLNLRAEIAHQRTPARS